MEQAHRMRAATRVLANYVPIPYPKWITLPDGKQMIAKDAAEELALLAHSACARRGGADAGRDKVERPSQSETGHPAISAAAVRMRRMRERRHDGRLVLSVEIHERDIAALVAGGHLAEADQRDPAAIARALRAMLCDTHRN
jgi:hypothetical protein